MSFMYACETTTIYAIKLSITKNFLLSLLLCGRNAYLAKI